MQWCYYIIPAGNWTPVAGFASCIEVPLDHGPSIHSDHSKIGQERFFCTALYSQKKIDKMQQKLQKLHNFYQNCFFFYFCSLQIYSLTIFFPILNVEMHGKANSTEKIQFTVFVGFLDNVKIKTVMNHWLNFSS